MGWWSETIMGGDSPLDWEYVIYDKCETKMYSGDKKNKIPKKKFEFNLPFVITKINSDDCDSEIGYQVLGVVMMSHGFKMDDKTKKLILKGAKKDTWAKEDETRKKYINDFIKTVKNYNGIPTEIASEGLFQVMAGHNKPGLINKNV